MINISSQNVCVVSLGTISKYGGGVSNISKRYITHRGFFS